MEAFNCPITYEEMNDPVIAMDGHTYERSAIERWISQRNNIAVLSPMTGINMGRLLIPNYALKKAIDEYKTRPRTIISDENAIICIESELMLSKYLLKLVSNKNNTINNLNNLNNIINNIYNNNYNNNTLKNIVNDLSVKNIVNDLVNNLSV